MKAAAAGAGLVATGETLAQPREPQALSFSAAVDGTAFKATQDLTPYERRLPRTTTFTSSVPTSRTLRAMRTA